MQIDRSNYEIWFIDWLDGNLSNLQVKGLQLFLNQNPDLKEELKDFTPVRLASREISFPDKDSLKKQASDLSPSQFDYLCAASLENDLNLTQQKELEEIITEYPDRKKTYDLILKTKIIPVRISYKHKNLLLKRTTFQKVIWLSVTGISAAAAIVLIIISISVKSGTNTVKPVAPAQKVISEDIPSATTEPPAQPSASSGQAQGGYRKMSAINKSPLGVPIAIGIGVNHSERAFKTASSADSSLRITVKQEEAVFAVIKVPVNPVVDLGQGIVGNTLIASNPANNFTDAETDAEDERSRAGKFISKTFREKLLKEKKSSDSPLEGYDIAEAGVLGLNKLFGWQMALDRKKDATGQPKSISFRSKMLTLNVPVKKRELQP